MANEIYKKAIDYSIKPWKLGCKCVDCRKELDNMIEKYQINLDYKVTIRGNCGVAHNSFEEWQQCQICRPTIKLDDNVYKNEIWNAALDYVAKIAEYNDIGPEKIRSLKK